MEQEKTTQVTEEVQITPDNSDGENRVWWKGRSKETSNNKKDYLAEEKQDNRRQMLHKRKHGRWNEKEKGRQHWCQKIRYEG